MSAAISNISLPGNLAGQFLLISATLNPSRLNPAYRSDLLFKGISRDIKKGGETRPGAEECAHAIQIFVGSDPLQSHCLGKRFSMETDAEVQRRVNNRIIQFREKILRRGATEGGGGEGVTGDFIRGNPQHGARVCASLRELVSGR